MSFTVGTFTGAAWAVLQFSKKRRHLTLDETSYFPAKLESVARVRDVPFD
jgi:hypothetical protein